MNGSRPRGRPRTFDRDALLDAALEQFWLKGFEGASLSDLTTASGCTAPTLYAQFGSKEGLFEEALRRYTDQSFGPRAQMLAGASADRAAMEAILRATIESSTMGDHPPGCLILTGGLSAAGSAPAAAVAAWRAVIFDGLKAFLDRAHADGHLGPCDTSALARFYLVVLQGITAQAFDGATREQLEPVIASALAAWPPATRDRSEA